MEEQIIPVIVSVQSKHYLVCHIVKTNKFKISCFPCLYLIKNTIKNACRYQEEGREYRTEEH